MIRGHLRFGGHPRANARSIMRQVRRVRVGFEVKDIQATEAGLDLGDIKFNTGRLTVQLEPTADNARLELQEFDPIWPFGNAVGRLLNRTDHSAPFVFESVPMGKFELICYRPQ